MRNSIQDPAAALRRWQQDQVDLAAATQDWADLAQRLEVRVGSRSARVADALRVGHRPTEAIETFIALGPRLALDLVVRLNGRVIPAAARVRVLGLPLSAGLRAAMHAPQTRWLQVPGRPPGHVEISGVAGHPGIFSVHLHPTDQLAALLMPVEQLLPGGQPVVLPLSPDKLYLADARSQTGLRTLLSLAEAAREQPNSVCGVPHAPTAEAGPGGFRWRPWRPASDHPLRSWIHRITLLQDHLDDRRTVCMWTDPPAQPLRLFRDVQAAGGLLSVASWPRTPCSLPAADCFDVEGPDGRVMRVWVDGLLDVLNKTQYLHLLAKPYAQVLDDVFNCLKTGEDWCSFMHYTARYKEPKMRAKLLKQAHCYTEILEDHIDMLYVLDVSDPNDKKHALSWIDSILTRVEEDGYFYLLSEFVRNKIKDQEWADQIYLMQRH